jgi:hypothetical protein
MHLFTSIKKSVDRCISFSNTKALFDLHNCFKNIFRSHYLRQLIKQAPANDPKRPSLSEEEELTLAHIINTCEYCDQMIPSLEELIKSKIDESYVDKVDFTHSKEEFAKCVNQCLERILGSLDAKIKGEYRKINSVSWANFVKV